MAHIHHHSRSHRPHGPGGRRLLGALVFTGGVVLLLRALYIPGLEDLYRWFWPAALVGTGISALAFCRGGERAVGGLLLAIGLPVAANRLFGWDLHVWNLVWPALLVFFGARMLFRPPRAHDVRVEFRTSMNAEGPAPPGPSPIEGELSGAPGSEPMASTAPDTTDPGSTIKEFAFLGGIERNNTSQAFRGGEITAALSGVQLDLRECRMAPEGARLDVLAFMGGVSLRIPRDWCVVSDVSVMLGGMDNRTSAPVDGAAPKLQISGQAIMGGIEIRN